MLGKRERSKNCHGISALQHGIDQNTKIDVSHCLDFM